MRKKLSRILVTGGAGFIGSEFIRQAVRRSARVSVVDTLTYAGDVKRLSSVRSSITFHKNDLCDRTAVRRILTKERPDYIVHFAAESHVDRSIFDSGVFIDTNVKGMQILLDEAQKIDLKRFVHISTDEVYGDIKRGRFSEDSPLRPNSPYAASKAAADLLAGAYRKTFQLPISIIRPSNNFGPWQYPEKFIPVAIYMTMYNKPIPIYGKGLQMREWLHVSDCAKAIFTVLRRGKAGEVYNVGSGNECRNIDLARMILAMMKKPKSNIVFVADRPGHDFRYALTYDKIQRLGWRNRVCFENGLQGTVDWYVAHKAWLARKVGMLSRLWSKVYRKQDGS